MMILRWEKVHTGILWKINIEKSHWCKSYQSGESDPNTEMYRFKEKKNDEEEIYWILKILQKVNDKEHTEDAS